MKRFSPQVMSVDFGEIDCAHYGSWSRYVEAIERTDLLTWRLWQTAQSLPDYRDKTLMLVLPDHGRELERPGGPGFLHHSDFYTNQGADEGCRRVWMLAVGPGVPAGKTIDRPVPITAAAATGLGYLGMKPCPGAAPAALDVWASAHNAARRTLTVWRHAAGIGPEATASCRAGRRGGSSLPEISPPAGRRPLLREDYFIDRKVLADPQNREADVASNGVSVGHQEGDVLLFGLNAEALQDIGANPGTLAAGVHQQTGHPHRLAPPGGVDNLARHTKYAHNRVLHDKSCYDTIRRRRPRQ